ncbi:hypothetical protein I3842_01G127300 [Carya illinoinensis]|uniref:Uncharacterized protein n=1 Tax=Carya illinoinensis TaxID=32201 RepID=A0A922FZS7_CARIL|nr:hypothetical protein I3842_01G127300 [Carya illinoinensis]
MAEENTSHGQITLEQATTWTSIKASNTVPYYKLFSFADFLDYLLMFVCTVAAVGSGSSMPFMTIIFRDTADSLEKEKDLVHEVSKVFFIKFVYLALGSSVASFLQVACWTVTGERQAARIRSLYLKTILRQDISFFGKEIKTGEIAGRMSGDIVLIQNALGKKVGKFIQLVGTFIGGFVIAFVKGLLLALVMLSSFPLLVISAAAMSIIIGKMASNGQTAYSVAATVVEQTIGSIRTVASYTGEREAVTKYNKSLTNAYVSGVQEGLVAGLGHGAAMFIICCSYALAMWFGGKMILEKACTGGINNKPQMDACNTNGLQLDDIRGDIELRDVYFSYPTRPEEHIFTGFSFSIPSGTTATLVGQSGSWKSTVINLIERLYDPQAGEVLIDNINLRDQEPLLFTSSIKDNIAYGKDGATTEEIRAAAELANAAKFIDKLPQGQKQRIALARAILKDPRILLLDEATTALDAESERIVQEAFPNLFKMKWYLSTHCMLLDLFIECTHSEMIKDPEGPYSQLKRLQNLSTMSEQNALNDLDRPEVVLNSGRISSPQFSLLGSISRESPAIGNRSCHSFSTPFGVPTATSVLETEAGKTSTPASAPAQLPLEVSLCHLAYLNKPEVPVLLLGTTAAAASGVILPSFRIVISHIINTFYRRGDELLLLGVASLLAQPSKTYFFAVVGCKLIRRIRLMCFEKVVYMEVSWFDGAEHSSGALGLVGDALALLVENLATAIAGLVIAFTANWILALIILVLLPLVGVNGYLQMEFMKGFSADAKKMYEEASQVANDAVGGSIRTVSSFCAEEKIGIRQGLINGVLFGLSLFLLFSVYACSFYVGARLVEDGKTTFSEFSRVDSSDTTGTTIENLKGDIEIYHVSFRYPTRPDVQIFRDLCLTINSGKTVALVGESGSGKSTVISLLQRFYEPDSGPITLDGIELQKLQLKWLRQQMELVSQDPVLFNDTIRTNIAYGKEGNAAEAEILAVAELANANEFICNLQQGYDTTVGERGVQLSGGQKQRVAIARATLKAPKILLLAEATSALDAESEQLVQDALERVMAHRTTVVVAHGLSTIKGADLIVVLKDGVVAEKENIKL